MKPVLVLGVGAALALGPFAALAQQGGTPAPAAKPTCKANYLPLGKIYYANGQYDAAYVAFRGCVTLEPKNVEGLYNLGRAEINLRLFSAAIGHLREAIATDPKFVGAYIALSQAFTEQWVNAKDRKAAASQLDEALRVLDDADGVAARNPDKAAVANQRGLIYKYKGDGEKALQAFRDAARLAPGSSAVMFNLGTLQLESGQTDAAIESLREGVAADPRDYLTRAYLARALRVKGDLRGARNEAQQAFNTSSASRKDPFVVGQYGIVLYLLKETPAARAQLESAIKLDPGARYHENMYYLGRLQLDSGNAAEARSTLSKAAFLNNQDAAYYFYLGRANEASGDKAAARASYERAVQLRPDFPGAKDALAKLK